jgi:hypothetical protein
MLLDYGADVSLLDAENDAIAFGWGRVLRLPGSRRDSSRGRL